MIAVGCLWVSLWLCGCVSFTYFGQLLRCPHKRIVNNNESVHQKEQHTDGINTIPKKLAPLLTFETVKWKYTTDMLSVTRRHCGPDVSLRDMSYRDKNDSGLHNFTISSYHVQAVRTESRYKRQFGSNSLLFIPFKTV